MKRFLAVLALFSALALAAPGDRELAFDNATLTLTKGPCNIGQILAEVNPQHRKHLKGGTVQYKTGRVAKLCYMEQDGVVGLRDEDGFQTIIPAEAFEPVGKPKAQPAPKGSVAI
jgi:hypothetical protein